MGMITTELKRMRSLVSQAKRDERRANNEMSCLEQQSIRQLQQLEDCINYKEDSLNGLQSAKESGLTVIQIRECKLLVEYLDSVMETRQFKADISQENYENARLVWQDKQEHLKKLQQSLQPLEDENNERMIDDIKPSHDKSYKTYGKS